MSSKRKFNCGNIEISSKDLPEGWEVYQEDSWTIKLEHENFSSIIIFFAGDHDYKYSISSDNSSHVKEKFFNKTPNKEDILNYIRKVEGE